MPTPVFPVSRRHLLTLAGLLALGSIAARASESVPKGWFAWPLVMPKAGSALDASGLNAVPAGAHGRIRVEDGHFVTGDGHRIRFWGANLTADDAFVSAKRADELAELFARNGINIVRLHHLDNPWAIKTGGSIWRKDRADHLEIDPAQLDKIHRLVAAFKARGIYIDINLKVSKTLVAADGFPTTVSQFPDFQKRIDMADRRMIELQKLYAREFLGPVNPYTGYSLAEDPAVATVETNNENSLLGYWTRDLGRGIDAFPEPFRGEIRTMWNAWLAKRYATDAALAAAWEPAAASGTAPLLAPDAKWLPHLTDGSQVEILPGSNGTTLKVRVLKTTGQDWHVQVSTGGLPLEDRGVYTIEFDARADKPRTIQVSVSNDPAGGDEWRSFGVMQTFALTPAWVHERVVFPAHGVGASKGALSFNVGQATGTVSLKNLRFFAGCAGAGLQRGQSARAGTVPLPITPSKAQWADWIAFLADTERSYADEMRAYLRNDLHVKAPITITQIEYGGIEGLWREQGSDYADSHAYWQHPSFAGGAWNLSHWSIANSPQLAVFTDRNFGALGGLAMNRVAGKPLTVSEYDHPAPSDFVSEMYPTFAAFAARQDWDGLYPFAMGDVRNPNHGAISNFFDQQHHPAKWGLSRFATLVFREALVPAAPAAAVLRPGTPPWSEAYHEDTLWKRLIPTGPIGFLDTRLSVSDAFLPAGERVRVDRVGTPVPGPVRVVAGPAGKLFIIDAPQAAAVVGFIGGADQAAGPLKVSCPRFGRNFGAVTAVSLDGKTLPESGRILVTLVARAENQGMIWNSDRTSVGGNWGHGPTIAERIPASLSLACSGPRRVFALVPDGTRARQVASTYADGRLSFRDSAGDATIDYEIVAP